MSKQTGVPRNTIIDAIRDGRLTAEKVGFLWIVDETSESYTQFLANHRPKGGTKKESENEAEADQ